MQTLLHFKGRCQIASLEDGGSLVDDGDGRNDTFQSVLYNTSIVFLVTSAGTIRKTLFQGQLQSLVQSLIAVNHHTLIVND